MLIFIYDKLLTKDEQNLLGLDMEFICYAKARANLYYRFESKQKQTFIIPNRTKKTGMVFGAVFYINEEGEPDFKLSAYYNNSEYFTGIKTQNDTYIREWIKIKQIRITALNDINKQSYIEGNETDVIVYAGNLNNKLIQKSVKKGKTYRMNPVDAKYFKILFNERRKENELEGCRR